MIIGQKIETLYRGNCWRLANRLRWVMDLRVALKRTIQLDINHEVLIEFAYIMVLYPITARPRWCYVIAVVIKGRGLEHHSIVIIASANAIACGHPWPRDEWARTGTDWVKVLRGNCLPEKRAVPFCWAAVIMPTRLPLMKNSNGCHSG